MCAHNHFVFYVKYKKKGKQQKKVNILSSKDLAYSTGLLYRINMLLNVPTSQLSVVKSLFGHSLKLDPVGSILGQKRASMPLYIAQSGDLEGCHACLTDNFER